MSCLLSEFKWHPDTFSIHFRTNHHHGQLPKNRELVFFRPQCVLSTSPATTSMTTTTAKPVLDLEKLRLPSLEPYSDSGARSRPWTYIGSIGPPKEATCRTSIVTETFITSDEAIIAAAAAEAVTLAKAAVKFAKDAVLLANNCHSMQTESKLAIPFMADAFSSRWSQLTEKEQASIIGDSVANEPGIREECSLQDPIKECKYLEPTQEELTLLEQQLSEAIAVKSRRQIERKARRERAAEKSAASPVSVRPGSTSKKKRGSLRDVDYSDPLHYLRGTTSTSRLLTATEELELSKGIQDLLKLERLQDELAGRCGGQPTFAQWAAAAGVDQKTLRKHINYGSFCKDKMIKCNIRLVISIAKNYQRAGMNLQDLVQEGCRGLVKGAEKFDASKGFKFSTYAHWWIKQAVRRSLSDQSRTIRLPVRFVFLCPS
uniref:RNA polymerase sigma factor sigB isoform X2 n=1 Tax=Rhizophora mucronata TaxID=61149 RepID=A0A2P2LPG8_RHIMU